MPRKRRHFGKYEHLMIRGNNKQTIFVTDSDYRYYINKMKKYTRQLSVRIIAYCLMHNHVHILLDNTHSTESLLISTFMKKLSLSYTIYFNKKYERIGHLLQDRFKNVSINTESSLLNVFTYILNNPFKAGICTPQKYRWCSYKDFFHPKITNPEIIKQILNNRPLETLLNNDDEHEFTMDINETIT